MLLQRDRFLGLLAPGSSVAETDGTMCTITPARTEASSNTASYSFQPKDGERFYLFHHFLKEQRELNSFTVALRAKKKFREEQMMIKAEVFRLHRQKAAADKLHGAKQLSNHLFESLKAKLKTAPAPVATLRETQLMGELDDMDMTCLLYTSPSPRD